MQASLTGHLVFSTLHTNDAPSADRPSARSGPGAVPRHRHARRHHRPAAGPPDLPQLQDRIHAQPRAADGTGASPEDVEGRNFYYGKGCETCNNTGYRGRQGLYEIMLLDDEMRDMIIQHASTQVLRIEAKKRGMRTLRQSGLMAIYDGVTSIEEVVRETIMEDA